MALPSLPMRMRLFLPPTVVITALMIGSAICLRADPGAAQAPAPVNDHRATKDDLERWMRELSNWGRWGTADELGALNLITPSKRKEALRLAKDGITVSLGHDLGAPTPLTVHMRITPDASEPGAVATDRQDVDFHGGVFTHLDALCHVAYGGKIYNGHSFAEIVTQDGGCSRLGVLAMKDGIVTRGVLLDIPRLKGVPYLEPGTHVYREDIEAWEKKAGVRVSAGDAILLRTGRWPVQEKFGQRAARSGFDASVAPFLKERDVAFVVSDWTQDVGTVPGFLRPIHRFALVALGAPMIDNADLEALGLTAARLNRWEFLLTLAPPRIPHSTGSAINPIAVF